ncbi:MAG: DUF1326 domain-containing protein [Catenulispora sp.]|nr:DUF1326 domain-containing protein [Catenulispora sp.]NUR60266.1 DUF1326 domain-containing protein [Catenulispora sp.]
MTEQATVTDTRWRLAGDWFDTCKCAIPCPCTFAQAPTSGYCEGIMAWHIREGSYGEVRLDDLNALMVGSFVGNLWAGEHTDPYAAIFFDERADEQQRAALGAIFSGQAGGWPAQFGAMFHPEMRGMEFVPIRVGIDAELECEGPRAGQCGCRGAERADHARGARVQVHNAPGAEVGPGQVATWGRATAHRADVFGFTWDRAGCSSKYFPFDWSGPD